MKRGAQLFLYNLAISAYVGAIRLAALFNPKAKAWWQGRRQTRQRIRNAPLSNPSHPVFWFHCASLGEFEQGRPVIELLKRLLPESKIVLTFFSPSGYEIRKDYAFADEVLYLPVDTPRRASQFLDWLQPDLAVFVKYEFWYHIIHELQLRGIPTFLISAVFRPDQLFFKPFGGLFREILRMFEHIFVQNADSLQLLEKIGINHARIAGDTRVDRVLEIAARPDSYPSVEAFCDSKKVWVIGSSWPKDEALLIPLLNQQLPPDWKCILAPHEISDKHVRQIQQQLELPTIRYSRIPQDPSQARVLILDTIGMLAHIYQYGDLAYIGGGFGQGIHNILEPAAHGLPVLFGPKHQKFPEAVNLLESGGAFAIHAPAQLQQIWKDMQDDNLRSLATQKVRAYVEEHRGASRQIAEKMLERVSSDE